MLLLSKLNYSRVHYVLLWLQGAVTWSYDTIDSEHVQ